MINNLQMLWTSAEHTGKISCLIPGAPWIYIIYSCSCKARFGAGPGFLWFSLWKWHQLDFLTAPACPRPVSLLLYPQSHLSVVWNIWGLYAYYTIWIHSGSKDYDYICSSATDGLCNEVSLFLCDLLSCSSVCSFCSSF